MPNYQLGDSEKAPFALTELDADSNPATPNPADVIAVTSSDTASATIVMDATPAAGSVASGWVFGGKKLQNGVTLNATVTHPDGTSLSVVDLIDVVGGAASSLSLGLGAPVSQGTTPPPPPPPPPTGPTITSIFPTSGDSTAPISLAIIGTGFTPTSTVAVDNPLVAVSGTNVMSDTQIAVTLTIDPTAITGPCSVTVTAGTATSAPATFTVNATSGTTAPSSRRK